MPRKHTHQKLHEVNAFLQRLQRFDEEPRPPAKDRMKLARRPLTFRTLSSMTTPRFPRGLILIVASALAFFAGDLGFRHWRVELDGPTNNAQASLAIAVSFPGAMSEASLEMSPTVALGKAQRLMDAGQISAARQLLLRSDVAATQGGAWSLARSYDPNYLASLPSSDTSSDKAQAAVWYRRWRDIAVSDGMSMDDVHLKRLIDFMG
jgi:hypothetical protein